MGWLRNFVRRNTNPIDPKRALRMKRILSGLYFFSAWNAFAFTIYFMITTNNPKSAEDQEYPSKYYHRLIGAGDARVIRFQGLTKVGDYRIEGAQRKEPETSRVEQEPEKREKFEEKANDEDLGLLIEESNSL